MNRLDHSLDAHRHLVIRLVVSQQVSEALCRRFPPCVEHTVDERRVHKLDMIDHAVLLSLQRNGRGLALGAYARRPRLMLTRRAGYFDTIR